MFRDGWVCRACWKSNRPQDTACYVCKAPREVQPTADAGTPDRTGPVTRLDARFGLLAALVAWPLRILGVVTVILSTVGFIIVALGGSGESLPPVFGLGAKTFALIFMFGLAVLGALQVIVAKAVQQHARWAYVVALLIGVAVSAQRLVEGPPAPVVDYGRDMAAYWGTLGVYAAIAVLSAVLLVASFVDHEAQARSVETG